MIPLLHRPAPMPRLIDTTLREGEQTPGLHLRLATKKRIVAGLTQTAVDEIELGVVSAANPDLAALVRHLATHFPCQPFSLWCRCRADDIRLAASLRPTVLALSIPASDLHLQKKFNKDRAWARSQVATSIRQARELGLARVALGLEDASRADPAFLRELAVVARAAGAFRLRLADTVGIAEPAMMGELVQAVAGCGLEVAVHCHNDFGMATANTLHAFRNGALWGDATLLGLGERAGNCRLEEIMAYLVLQKGEKQYDLAALVKLCRQVARATGRDIVPHQPLLGADIFTCQSGIHQQGLLADPTTYEPFAPERVGATRKLLMGSGSGHHGLAAALARLQLPRPSRDELNALGLHLRRQAARLGRPLYDHELCRLLAGRADLPG